MMSIPRKIESHFQFKTPLIWKNIIGIFTFHLLALYGVYLLPSAKLLTILWGWFMGFVADTAISAGAHRLWTHRTYKAKLPLRIGMMLCYMLGGQYSLVQWARDHRTHHLFVDTDADPHSAARGFFYSHVGWLLMKRHPECKEKGRKVDISDLYKDPVVRFHQKHFYLLLILVHVIFPSAVAYYVIGDTLKHSIFIAFFLRYAMSLNLLWCVNSVAHYWGDKPYDNDILATQHVVMAFFMVGEGWHNFHHTFPFDYRIGERGQRFQFSAIVIDACARLGWVTDRRTATQNEIDRAVEKNKKKMQEDTEQKLKIMAAAM